MMRLLRPTKLDEAIDALAADDARPIAGGTALQLTWEAGAKKPGVLVDLSQIEELRGHACDEGSVRLGALTRISALIEDEALRRHLPLLATAARDVGGPSVRSMGTVGGQIGWGAGCLLPAMLALDAQVEWISARGSGTCYLDAFLAQGQDALVTAITVPTQPDGGDTVWRKVGLRAAFTPGVIAVAAVVVRDGDDDGDGDGVRRARLAVGSGATRPQRLKTVEDRLCLEGLGALDAASLQAAIDAPDDHLRSSRYRKRVAALALLDGLGRRTCDRPPIKAAFRANRSPSNGERRLSRKDCEREWYVRSDLADKVSGKPVFLTDLRPPNALFGSILRADYPHARILSIDTSKAEALTGVRAVVTHKDVPGLNAFGIVVQDQPALCDTLVRYEGDPVAAVAADTKEIADQAINLIDVTYEPLPVVDDPFEALKPTAAQLHPDGNLRKTVTLERGDVDAAFAAADFVVEDTYSTPRQMHGFLETEGGVVTPTDDGGILVQCGGQHGGRDREQLARILALPEEKIEVVTSPIGGGFGGKDELTVQPALALLALKAKQPVRLHLSRRESVRAGTKRNPFRITMKTACDAAGNLTAQKVDAIADGGAHASLSLAVIETAMEHACGPYSIPNASTRGRLVATNNGTCGAFRGFGCNEMTFAVECQIERLAALVGLDPIDMRRKNIRQAGTPGTLGQKVGPTERLSAMLDAAAASPIWTDDTPLRPGEVSGVGMALCYQGNGLGTLPPDEGDVELALAADGKIEARYGLDEMGQGMIPAVASAVAQALRVCRDDIRVVFGDTRATPDSGSTTASRGTYVVWKGAQVTAPGLRTALLKSASRLLNRPVDTLALVPGGIGDARTNSRKPTLTFADLAASLNEDDLPVERQHLAFPKSDYTKGNARFLFISGATLARVAVDRVSGMVRVVRLAQHSASGPVLDVASYLGQMEGAASQGLGLALTEHIAMDQGRTVNGNLDTYVMPSLRDRPEIIDTYALEELDAGDPYGPRGVGELGIAGAAPAVANAVAQALELKASAVWPTELPLSPEATLGWIAP
ncbi:MAG: molybdopterin cofactor-binding domain-containing protein [Pseudomonadota bacterium]